MERDGPFSIQPSALMKDQEGPLSQPHDATEKFVVVVVIVVVARKPNPIPNPISATTAVINSLQMRCTAAETDVRCMSIAGYLPKNRRRTAVMEGARTTVALWTKPSR